MVLVVQYQNSSGRGADLCAKHDTEENRQAEVGSLFPDVRFGKHWGRCSLCDRSNPRSPASLAGYAERLQRSTEDGIGARNGWVR